MLGSRPVAPDRAKEKTLTPHAGWTMRGRYRLRTRLRRRLPWWLVDLGVAPKGKHDCGAHEWYRESGDTWRCYHCEVGVRRDG
jgi:hypothetical protein